jgi:hypothetical protein
MKVYPKGRANKISQPDETSFIASCFLAFPLRTQPQRHCVAALNTDVSGCAFQQANIEYVPAL